ncbi:MAG: nicotinate-nucleotide adenylyltransferase [Thioalkalivibrio sp.]|nr:nicotinate-nucleotide adenylyltransferase [Thioalkalivibrio sp.]
MIGVLGGTFDPIHFGHLRPALEVHECLGLCELRFIPSHEPPHRGAPAAAARHRLAMVERAIAGVPGFMVDSRELDRSGPSYTVDTLRSLRDEIGSDRPLLLIMGLDAFAGLDTWHRWREIPALAHVVVARRPGSSIPKHAAYLERAAATESPSALEDRAAGLVLFQPVTQLDISATDIRKRLRAGHSPRYLLPDSVRRYINEHDLYQPDTEDP